MNQTNLSNASCLEGAEVETKKQMEIVENETLYSIGINISGADPYNKQLLPLDVLIMEDRKAEGETMITISDGPSSASEGVDGSESRDQAQRCVELMDISLDQGKLDPNINIPTVGSKIKSLPNMAGAVIEVMGIGDSTILVLTPNDKTFDYSTEGLDFLYYNPEGKASTTMTNASEKYLPSGSIVIMASDGGLQALFSENTLRWLDKMSGVSKEENDPYLESVLAGLEPLEKSQEVIARNIRSLTDALNRRLQEEGPEKFAQSLVDVLKEPVITAYTERTAPDDVSLVLTLIK